MANGWFQLETGKRGGGRPSGSGGGSWRERYVPAERPAPVEEPDPQPEGALAGPAEPVPLTAVPAADTEPEVIVSAVEPSGDGGEWEAAVSEPEAEPVEAESPAPETIPVPEQVVWERPGGPLPDPYGDELEIIHTQTVGENGPAVLRDTVLHETLCSFVSEKTVERVVHVKGWGAFGHFTPYRDLSEYTMLPFLRRPGVQVPTVSRFSLAVSNKGTPDTSRNVRGFSTKFDTGDGVFDLLCNHVPVFSVRDAIRFPESIKALQPSPVSNLLEPERFWDFVARCPEALHFVTWLYSDVGTVKSLRHLRAYGVNAYVWRNAAGRRRYVKYHWAPMEGVEFIDAAEAAKLACQDPDCAGRDLWEAIEGGNGPEYELRVQLMDPQEGETLPFDPLDDTKIWDEARWPLMPVGKLTLDRNPEHYATQVEKLAFSPANLLPGAELSGDKMLQGRSFIYWDAQRRRLGPDFRSIPVNRQAGWSPDRLPSSGLGVEVDGVQMRSDLRRQDDFTQAGQRYEGLDETGRAHLAANIAADLGRVTGLARQVVMDYFRQASPVLAEQIAGEWRT